MNMFALAPAAALAFALALVPAPAPAPDEPEPVVSSPVGTGERGYSGDGGPASSARLNQPFDVKYDRQGNLYLSDTFNHVIRRVDAKTGLIATVAGNGRKGFSGDGGPAVEASLDEPYGVVLDDDGNLYFADRLNRRVRRVDAKTGLIATVAGDGSDKTSGDGGPATGAGIVEPNGVALDRRGNLLVADVAGCRVRVVDLRTGIIDTFAGTGRKAHGGDGGPAIEADIHGARAVRVAPDGTVYILEREGNRLRAVSPDAKIIATVAGTGRKGRAGDGGPALLAEFNGPKELDVAPDGRVAVVDTENQLIRLYDPAAGVVHTILGSGTRGGAGDGGPPRAAQLGRPHGVAFAPDGAIVVGDTENHRIRRVAVPPALPAPAAPRAPRPTTTTTNRSPVE